MQFAIAFSRIPLVARVSEKKDNAEARHFRDRYNRVISAGRIDL